MNEKKEGENIVWNELEIQKIHLLPLTLNVLSILLERLSILVPSEEEGKIGEDYSLEGKEGIEKTRTWRNEKHDTEEEGPGRNVRDPPQIAATPSKPMPLPAAPSSFLLHPVVLIPADDPARDYASVPPPPPPSSRPALHLPPPVLSSARPPTRARRLTGGEARFHRLDSTQFPTSARLTLEKSISKSAKGWSKGGGVCSPFLLVLIAGVSVAP